jgi:hypothetical protein
MDRALVGALVGLMDASKAIPSRQPFTAEEDEKLKQLVAESANRDWKAIAALMGNRTARQCRERYKAYLTPDISNRPWQDTEDALLRQKYEEMGPKWAQMVRLFEGRSAVNLKNRLATITAQDRAKLEADALPVITKGRTDPPLIQGEATKSPAGDRDLLDDLWGLELRGPEWDVSESQLKGQELQKTFINDGGSAW